MSRRPSAQRQAQAIKAAFADKRLGIHPSIDHIRGGHEGIRLPSLAHSFDSFVDEQAGRLGTLSLMTQKAETRQQARTALDAAEMVVNGLKHGTLSTSRYGHRRSWITAELPTLDGETVAVTVTTTLVHQEEGPLQATQEVSPPRPNVSREALGLLAGIGGYALYSWHELAEEPALRLDPLGALDANVQSLLMEPSLPSVRIVPIDQLRTAEDAAWDRAGLVGAS